MTYKMACNITFNLGNKLNSIAFETIPKYKLKIDHFMTNSHLISSKEPQVPVIFVTYSYYDSQQSFPITSALSGPTRRENVTHRMNRLHRFIKTLKEGKTIGKCCVGYGTLIWTGATKIWNHRKAGYDWMKPYVNTKPTEIKLLLNDDSILQFIRELEDLLIFYKTMDYKYNVLNPSIRSI